MPIVPWTPGRSQSLAKLAAKGDSSYLYATANQQLYPRLRLLSCRRSLRLTASNRSWSGRRY